MTKRQDKEGSKGSFFTFQKRKWVHIGCCAALLLGDGNIVSAVSSLSSTGGSVAYEAVDPVKMASELLGIKKKKSRSRRSAPSPVLKSAPIPSGAPKFTSHTYIDVKEGNLNNANPSLFEGVLHVFVPGIFSNTQTFAGKEGTYIQAGRIVNSGTGLGTGGETVLRAEEDLHNTGKIQGGTSLKISAGRNVVSQTPLGDNEIHAGTRDHRSSNKIRYVSQKAELCVNDPKSPETLQVEAGKDIVLTGTKIHNPGSGEIRLSAGNIISAQPVTTYQEWKSHYTDIEWGFFGKTGYRQDQEQVNVQSIGTQIVGGGHLRSDSKQASNFKNTEFQGASVEITAGDKLFLQGDKNATSKQNSWSDLGVVWGSEQSSGNYDETFQPTKIRSSGSVKASAKAGISVDKAVNTTNGGIDPGVARALQGQNNVTYIPLREDHRQHNIKASGLTNVGTVLLVLGVNALTGGAGGAVAGSFFVPGSIAYAATQAGVNAVISRTAVSLVNNQGNVGATLASLTSTDALKSIGATMLTAGLTQGVLSAVQTDVFPRVDQVFFPGKIGITQSAGMANAGTFSQRLPVHIAMGLTSTAINGILSGGNPDAIRNAALGALANALGTEASLELGERYYSGQLGWVPHKFAHSVVGCVTGALSGGSCVAGAAGAAVGEIVGESYVAARHKSFTNVADATRQATDIARFAGGFAGLVAGGDPTTGAQTAGIAAENNSAKKLVPLMIAAGYATLEGEGNPRKGLRKIGKRQDTLTKLAEGPIGQAVSSAVADVMDVAYETFPETMERLKGFASDENEPDFTITYLDKSKGQIMSRFWKSLDRDTQDELKGVERIASILFFSNSVKDVNKLVQIAKNEVRAVQNLKHLAPPKQPNPHNVLDALRLKTELAFKDAGILDNHGKLTPYAIRKRSDVELKGGIKNKQIIDQLTKDGSDIKDWKKYTTPSVKMPNGDSRQIHFYMNEKTGKVDYETKDYKVKDEVSIP